MSGNENSFLSGKSINSQGIIENGDIRGSSIDLKVGIIFKNGEPIEPPYLIKEQEMITVVFENKFTIPKNCFGIAFPKTSQSQKGLHVLNTGIVDPGYSGLLSTTVLNYSKAPLEIRKGDVFLRLIVFKNSSNYTDMSVQINDEQYYCTIAKESAKYPDTFLNISNQVENISEQVSSKILNKLMIYIGLLTLLITAIISLAAFLVPQILERLQ